MKLMEMFTSWQGEGCNVGKRCTFIRLAGCSLRCHWCDTMLSWSDEDVEDMSVDKFVKKYDFMIEKNVVITGGEPTEQGDLPELVTALKQRGHWVALESNGTYEHYASLGCDWVTCSPKPKASYCLFTDGVDEVKYVVTGDFSDKVAIPESVREKFAGRIWLQPCDMQKSMVKKAMDISQSDSRLRVGVQLHKIDAYHWR